MSFKDVRDLSEHLKLLGFPKVFPLTALATKHGCLASFRIVAEILQWLADLLEPGTQLPGSTDTEEERILLIRSATEFFITKSATKLNPRKLYAACAATATELQKITRLLISPALDGDNDAGHDEEDQQLYRSLNQMDIGDKVDDLRRVRDLSSDLTQRGAKLYDLLSKEMVNKEARLAQSNRPMELASVERALNNAIASVQQRLQSGRVQLENSRVEMNAINSKLQRKRAELERTKQRLEALQKIRPAHMQEFEECEKELRDLFQQYFLRLHVRDALRAQLEARTKRPTPVASPLLQKPTETSMPFIPGTEGLTDDDDEDNLDDGAVLRGGSMSVGGGSGGISGSLGLDNEISDIRDEDLQLNQKKGSTGGGGFDAAAGEVGRRPRTATLRIRPTTGRSRGRPAAGSSKGRPMRGIPPKKDEGKNGDGDDDDSTFGSSDSDLGGIIGVGRTMGNEGMGVGDDSAAGGIFPSKRVFGDDDEFDLNSMEDISISKLTGELPLRPKTANKPEQHSDEDF